jgi:hypothetical protein
VLREPGSGTRSEFEPALTGLGIERSGLPDLASNEAARAALESGLAPQQLCFCNGTEYRKWTLPFRLPQREFQV